MQFESRHFVCRLGTLVMGAALALVASRSWAQPTGVGPVVGPPVPATGVPPTVVPSVVMPQVAPPVMVGPPFTVSPAPQVVMPGPAGAAPGSVYVTPEGYTAPARYPASQVAAATGGGAARAGCGVYDEPACLNHRAPWASLADSACAMRDDWFRFDWLAGGRWVFGVDAIALRRDQSEEIEFAGGHNRPLVTGQCDPPFAAMPRLTAAFTINPAWRVEGLYFGLGEWQEDSAVRDRTPNLLGGEGDLLSRLSNFGRTATVGLDYNHFAAFDTESTFDNVELNLRHRFVTPSYMEFSGLVGLRYLDIGENVRFVTVSDTPGPGETINDLDTVSSNQLFGMQIGGDLRAKVEERWFVDFEAKAAICQNEADLNAQYTQTVNGASSIFNTTDDGTKTTFIGELSLTLNCQWTRNLEVHFGYHAIFIDGLVLATQNVEREIEILQLGPAVLNADGRVIYHGPRAGLTFSF